jgi:hypothetical protein
MTEKEKYLAWYKDQVESHGLIDISITVNPDVSKATEEEFYKELNGINKQMDNPDPEKVIEIKEL